jgi:hypothetical protein
MTKLSWPQQAALEYVAANQGRQGGGCRLSRITEPTRQRLIDLAMHEPPLIDTEGDYVTLTDAGRDYRPTGKAGG